MKKHIFICYFCGLLLATYRGIAEEFIIIFSVVLGVLRIKKRVDLLRINKVVFPFIFFLLYYGIITILGFVKGIVDVESLILFLVLLVLLPFSMVQLMSISKDVRYNSVIDLKNFIFLSSIYGTVEYLFRYNPIYLVMNIPSSEWIINMNNSLGVYQPSSFFLHYTYYGSLLLLGIVLLMVFPYKKKMLNILSFFLLSQQIFLAQSRICWIAYVFILLFYIFLTKRISVKKFKKKLLYIVLSAILSVFFIILLNPDLIINFLHTIIKRFSTLFIYGFDDGSLGQRVGTLMNWPKYFHKNNIQGLFGSGFNTIDNVFLNEYSYFRGYMTADCQYVSLLIGTGVLGLFIFLYSFVKVYFKSSKLTSSGIFLKLLLVSYAIQCITYDITTYFIFIPFLWGVVLYGTEKKQKGCNSNFIL